MSDEHFVPDDRIYEVTDASLRESYLYAQLHLRGHNTDEIGTTFTVALNRSYDAFFAAHYEQVRAAAWDKGKNAGIRQCDDEWRHAKHIHEAVNPYRATSVEQKESVN